MPFWARNPIARSDMPFWDLSQLAPLFRKTFTFHIAFTFHVTFTFHVIFTLHRSVYFHLYMPVLTTIVVLGLLAGAHVPPALMFRHLPLMASLPQCHNAAPFVCPKKLNWIPCQPGLRTPDRFRTQSRIPGHPTGVTTILFLRLPFCRAYNYWKGALPIWYWQ